MVFQDASIFYYCFHFAIDTIAAMLYGGGSIR